MVMLMVTKSQWITKVNRFHPLGTMHVLTTFHNNPCNFSLNQRGGLTDNTIPKNMKSYWLSGTKYLKALTMDTFLNYAVHIRLK